MDVFIDAQALEAVMWCIQCDKCNKDHRLHQKKKIIDQLLVSGRWNLQCKLFRIQIMTLAGKVNTLLCNFVLHSAAEIVELTVGDEVCRSPSLEEVLAERNHCASNKYDGKRDLM